MTLSTSRLLSLCAGGGVIWKSWNTFHGAWSVVFVVLALLVLIWSPEEVDDFMFGTTRDGNRIDVHTPPFMIAAFGWILLLLLTVGTFAPDSLARLFDL